MNTTDYIPFPLQAIDRHFGAPYDESEYRLLRMGVIHADGMILRDNLRAMTSPFIVTLYENLPEAGLNIMDAYEDLARMNCFEEHTGMYLYLCLLYGQIGEAIPEPLQWLSSRMNVWVSFCDTLVDLMTEFLGEDGYFSDDDEGETVFAYWPSNLRQL